MKKENVKIIISSLALFFVGIIVYAIITKMDFLDLTFVLSFFIYLLVIILYLTEKINNEK